MVATGCCLTLMLWSESDCLLWSHIIGLSNVFVICEQHEHLKSNVWLRCGLGTATFVYASDCFFSHYRLVCHALLFLFICIPLNPW